MKTERFIGDDRVFLAGIVLMILVLIYAWKVWRKMVAIARYLSSQSPSSADKNQKNQGPQFLAALEDAFMAGAILLPATTLFDLYLGKIYLFYFGAIAFAAVSVSRYLEIGHIAKLKKDPPPK